MSNFFTDKIQRDPRYRASGVVKDVDLLEPGFRARVDALFAESKAAGTELQITETFRSSERQRALFVGGKTRLRKVGVHHYGLAVDTVKRVKGRLTYDGDWTFMAPLLARHGLHPSGLSGDFNHIQGVTQAQQAGLFAGTWYPGGDGIGTVAPIPAIVPVERPPLATIPASLTAPQRAALVAADEVNARYFGGWFWRSSMMAFMEVESAFDPMAFRREPSGVASYGVMQVLDTTAAWLGHSRDPLEMFDLTVGIFYGCKYAAWGWNYLMERLGRPPTLEEWCDGYNAGYGAIVKGRDVPYSDRWIPARERWARIVD